MAKNLFDSLSPIAAFATKLFANAGLNLSEMIAKGDEHALKAHIDGLATGAGAKEAIEQATAKLQGELTAAEATLKVLDAQLAVFHAANIDFPKDAKPEAVEAALKARISMAAGEELAKHGLKEFPKQEVNEALPNANAQKVDPSLTGLARTQAVLQSKISGGRN